CTPDAENHVPLSVVLASFHQNFKKAGTVDDLWNEDVLSVNADSLLRDTVRKILSRNAPYVPVVDDDNNLKGIVTRATLTNVVYDTIWGDGSELEEIVKTAE